MSEGRPCQKNERIVCIACSIFRREVEALQAQAPLPIKFHWLDSVLHLNPERLHMELDTALKNIAAPRTLILYGDCHAHMLETQQKSGIARVQGLNCCEILLGREDYRVLRRQGAFFLLPEWVERWQQVLPAAIGLPESEAKTFMAESHTHLLYLDTGLCPVPVKTLDAITAYTSLPWHSRSVTLDHLRIAIEKAMVDVS